MIQITSLTTSRVSCMSNAGDEDVGNIKKGFCLVSQIVTLTSIKSILGGFRLPVGQCHMMSEACCFAHGMGTMQNL